MGSVAWSLLAGVGAGAVGAVLYMKFKKGKSLPLPAQVLAAIKNISKVQTLDYDFLMKSITDGRPQDDERVVSVAILKENGEDSFRISVVYMDKERKPVFGDGSGKDYGFAYEVKELDSELLNLFEKDNLVFLE